MRLFIGIENHTRSQFDDKTNIEFIEEEKKKPKTTQTNTVIGWYSPCDCREIDVISFKFDNVDDVSIFIVCRCAKRFASACLWIWCGVMFDCEN